MLSTINWIFAGEVFDKWIIIETNPMKKMLFSLFRIQDLTDIIGGFGKDFLINQIQNLPVLLHIKFSGEKFL